jgi:cold shock CspA family protein
MRQHDGNFYCRPSGAVEKLWDSAIEQNFSYEERIKRQYIPRDSADLTKRMRFAGVIQHVKPGYALIQPDEGSVVISTMTMVSGKILQRGQNVTFELTFSAKGAFAENLKIV